MVALNFSLTARTTTNDSLMPPMLRTQMLRWISFRYSERHRQLDPQSLSKSILPLIRHCVPGRYRQNKHQHLLYDPKARTVLNRIRMPTFKNKLLKIKSTWKPQLNHHQLNRRSLLSLTIAILTRSLVGHRSLLFLLSPLSRLVPDRTNSRKL